MSRAWLSPLYGAVDAPPARDAARLASARAAVNASHRLRLSGTRGDERWPSLRLALLLDAEALRVLLPEDPAARREHLAARADGADVDALLAAVDRAPAERDILSPERLIDEGDRVHRLALRELDALAARLDVNGPRRRRLSLLAGGAMALVALTWAALRVAPRLRPDLAPTAAWTASSVEPGYAAAGLGASSVGSAQPAFFHTAQQEDPWVRFDLVGRPEVGYVEVTNRGDCCFERAVPLLVEGDLGDGRWRELARRTTSFFRWSTTFPRRRLRALRLRARGNTWLHLSVVEIR